MEIECYDCQNKEKLAKHTDLKSAGWFTFGFCMHKNEPYYICEKCLDIRRNNLTKAKK